MRAQSFCVDQKKSLGKPARMRGVLMN